ncbi:MAG: phosphatase PAP2 family protein [Gemmatimonadales bacterium]|nr:phosphatase PAP2 family protein [Gemmatimonadales bacterium]
MKAFVYRINQRFEGMLFILILVSWCTVTLVASPAGAAGDGWRSAWYEDLNSLVNRESFVWLAGGGGLALIIHEFEDPDGIERALDGGWTRTLSDAGNIWGDPRVQAPLALVTWGLASRGLGSRNGQNRFASMGHDAFHALVWNYGTTGAIKIAANRTRPSGEDYSFPSGHTSGAFATAAVVWRHCGSYAGIAAVAAGVWTGMGRMADREHYASDVVFGATVGWAIGWAVGNPDGRSNSRVNGVNEVDNKIAPFTTWRLIPMATGVAVACHF